MGAKLLHQAQTVAAQLPPLLLEAEQIAQNALQGLHYLRRAGVGDRFWQFRRYDQGDPVTRIDWRQSARSDKIFVREREYEDAQNGCLWADLSGSMQFASHPSLPTKAERARILLLALSVLLLRGGEKVTWMQNAPITTFGTAGLSQIIARLDGKPLPEPPQIKIPRHSRIVLASDFLMPQENLMRLMQSYTGRSLRGVLLHILDPIEENFTLQGRIDLLGCEDEESLLLPNAAAIREKYLARLQEHKAYLKSLAQNAGWNYAAHVTSDPAHLALTKLYQFLDTRA